MWAFRSTERRRIWARLNFEKTGPVAGVQIQFFAVKVWSPELVAKTARPFSIRKNVAPEFFFTASADFAGTKTVAVVLAGMEIFSVNFLDRKSVV